MTRMAISPRLATRSLVIGLIVEVVSAGGAAASEGAETICGWTRGRGGRGRELNPGWWDRGGLR